MVLLDKVIRLPAVKFACLSLFKLSIAVFTFINVLELSPGVSAYFNALTKVVSPKKALVVVPVCVIEVVVISPPKIAPFWVVNPSQVIPPVISIQLVVVAYFSPLSIYYLV